MKEDPIKIDKIISEVHQEMPSPRIPDSFANRLAQKFEMRAMRRRLLEDWVLKLAAVVVIGLIYAAIHFLLKKNMPQILKPEYVLPVLGVLAIVFVFFFDQVVLKWMFFLKKQKNKHV
ncbi:hypothetical protein [Labilibacter marinus]|uniref:hypothetical protein n=1 Tax=Labilibacter marinus TaxID=1477105 RepID=UPI00094FF6BB|nr:hypothetical protein [Labilibacter marinus]